MNVNQVTSIIFILGLISTLITYILPVVPAEYVGAVTLGLALLSEAINYLKSGYGDRPVEINMNEGA